MPRAKRTSGNRHSVISESFREMMNGGVISVKDDSRRVARGLCRFNLLAAPVLWLHELSRYTRVISLWYKFICCKRITCLTQVICTTPWRTCQHNATSMQRTVLGQRKRSIIQTSKFKIRDYTSRHIYTQTTCMLQSSKRQKLDMWPLHISMLSCFFNNNFQESTLVHLPLTYNVSFSPVRERMQIYFPHILSRHDSESTALCTPCRAQSKLF